MWNYPHEGDHFVRAIRALGNVSDILCALLGTASLEKLALVSLPIYCNFTRVWDWMTIKLCKTILYSVEYRTFDVLKQMDKDIFADAEI